MIPYQSPRASPPSTQEVSRPHYILTFTLSTGDLMPQVLEGDFSLGLPPNPRDYCVSYPGVKNSLHVFFLILIGVNNRDLKKRGCD